MMKVRIQRTVEISRSIISDIYVDDQFECYGLEPSRTTPVHEGHPCIPTGTYKVILTPSPHLHYVTPEVLKVPDRSAIRWHIGNRPEDVLGCVAVGTHYSTDWVSESKVAFDKLMTLLKTATDGIEVTYLDPPEHRP